MSATPLTIQAIPDTLKAIQDAINEHERAANALREQRDDYIIQAVAADIPYKTITKWTGLSRSNIVRIQAKERR